MLVNSFGLAGVKVTLITNHLPEMQLRVRITTGLNFGLNWLFLEECGEGTNAYLGFSYTSQSPAMLLQVKFRTAL
jgi:hypothetical protein